MTTLKTQISKTHFYILGFVILNLFFKIVFNVSLNYNAIFVLKIIICLSGIALFFMSIKPFKKVAIYYSYYILTAIFLLLLWIFKGVFLVMVTSIFLVPIYQNKVTYKDDEVKVYSKFQGLFSACCDYEITELKFFFLEKHIGDIKTEEVIDQNSKFRIENDSASYQSGTVIKKLKIY